MDFRSIEFGKADAKEEGSELPELLIKGYFDLDNLSTKAISKSTYLFLGYKGAGKTALSEHIRLSNQDYNHFVKNILLEDFPYKSFGKIVPGDVESEAKLPMAWEWLFLLYMIESLTADQVAMETPGFEISGLISVLKRLGLLPIMNIKELVAKSSKNSFKISIADLLEFSREAEAKINEADLRFAHVMGILRRVIEEIKTPNYHFLIVDGLDEILTSKEIQYQSIAALINQAKNINTYFRQKELRLKVIILCRTDLFERLPHPNKNKIRQDSAYTFDWYEDSDSSANSNLIKIVNLRCALRYPEISDCFATFFPNHYEGRSIHSDLLSFTRHTPRDFLQLLKSIQSVCKGPKVTAGDMNNGFKHYSINYFLPEIKDELVGYSNHDDIETVFFLLSALRKRDFLLREIADLAERNNRKVSTLEHVFSALFECSAIGHVYKSQYGDKTQYTFKYRNRNMSFNPNDRIILHKGIWKSLNLLDI